MTDSAHQRPLIGVLERIIFSNAETHFCIGEFRLEKGGSPIVIYGNLPSVQCGETLAIDGAWTKHPTHGKQFKISRFEARLPSSVHGIRKYLGSGLVPGIGKAMAERIVDRFGTDTLRVLREESGRLKEVPGIGKQRAQAIRKAWSEQQAVRDLMIFLQTYGVGTHQALKLMKQYGNEAQEILKNQPYRIAAEIDGIGFKTADRIARNLSVANDSPARLDAGLLHVLRESQLEGHTLLPQAALCQQAAELLEVDPVTLHPRLSQLKSSSELSEPFPEYWQEPVMSKAEESIVHDIERLQAHASKLPPIRIPAAIEWSQQRARFTFADNQNSAISSALSHTVSLLTGGPGTGKTTILRAIVDILKAKKVRILLAAPTGRAAQRLSETARHYASTIHRLLHFDPVGGRFLVDRSSPLRVDFLIVDESSMLDTRLAAALLRAVPNGCHLLLVGDRHQLPSVGAGSVFADLLQSGCIPAVTLDQVFRQGKRSHIVTVAHAILQGQAGAPGCVDDPADVNPAHDLVFIRAPEPEQCLTTIVDLCRKHIPQWYKVDPIHEVQILSPLHRGSTGTSNLNLSLQQALNPSQSSLRFGTQSFSLGDKVIQTRNNYDKNVFNGDLGRITHIDPEGNSLQIDFDGQLQEYSQLDLADLQLAYAITIHKSQGSEFPIVILPLLKQHFILLQRNLLYTGITRGRRKVVIVGDPAAWAMAVNNSEALQRCTGLLRLLQ